MSAEYTPNSNNLVEEVDMEMQPSCADLAKTQKSKCPHAPTLKPRNTRFSGFMKDDSDVDNKIIKFNSTKNFMAMDNLVEYTPFFYSEDGESSGSEMEESTTDCSSDSRFKPLSPF